MKKISKHQKKWVELFNYQGGGIQLLLFLRKLKVLNRSKFIEAKDSIIDQVETWKDMEHARKCRHNDRQDAKTYNSRPPRSIKPTRARS